MLPLICVSAVHKQQYVMKKDSLLCPEQENKCIYLYDVISVAYVIVPQL